MQDVFTGIAQSRFQQVIVLIGVVFGFKINPFPMDCA